MPSGPFTAPQGTQDSPAVMGWGMDGDWDGVEEAWKGLVEERAPSTPKWFLFNVFPANAGDFDILASTA